MSADNDAPVNIEPTDGGEGPPIDEAEALKSENAALKDRVLRALAEAENMRKRAEREKSEAGQYAITRFARDLLSVADNLTRALEAFPAEKRANADEGMKAVLDGIEATAREFQVVLTRHGVKEIAAIGQKFDPHLHQAIAEIPGSGKPAGTIVGQMQSGYTIGDRLLRAAMVTVAKADGASGNGANVDTKV